MTKAPRGVQGADRRTTKRTKVFLPGTIARADEESTRAHVLDISSFGARVHAEQEQTVGRELTLTVDEDAACGSVEWVDGKRFGMSFAADKSS